MVVTVHVIARDLSSLSQVGLPAPDVVVYLRLDPRVSAARGGYGTERYEKVEFQQKVRHQQSRTASNVLYDIGLALGIGVSVVKEQRVHQLPCHPEAPCCSIFASPYQVTR